MDDLLEFPETFPNDAWTILLDAINGRAPDPWHTWHVAWHAAGYFSGKLKSNPQPHRGQYSEADAKEFLKSYCEAQVAGTPLRGAIDWRKLLEAVKTLLPVILALL